MRQIRWIGALAAVCIVTASAAAYQPAPMVIPTYQGYAIPSFRGQGCSMPVTFAPGPICGERVCCCCAHGWDNYCQPKGCGRRCLECDGVLSAPDGGQPVPPCSSP